MLCNDVLVPLRLLCWVKKTRSGQSVGLGISFVVVVSSRGKEEVCVTSPSRRRSVCREETSAKHERNGTGQYRACWCSCVDANN